MNEDSKLDITVSEVAKYLSISIAVNLINEGQKVSVQYLNELHVNIVRDIIENNSIKSSIIAFNNEIKKLEG